MSKVSPILAEAKRHPEKQESIQSKKIQPKYRIQTRKKINTTSTLEAKKRQNNDATNVKRNKTKKKEKEMVQTANFNKTKDNDNEPHSKTSQQVRIRGAYLDTMQWYL